MESVPSMRIKSRNFLFILLSIIVAAALAFGLNRWIRTREVPPIKEVRVEVEAIQPAGEGLWLVGKESPEGSIRIWVGPGLPG